MVSNGFPMIGEDPLLGVTEDSLGDMVILTSDP